MRALNLPSNSKKPILLAAVVIFAGIAGLWWWHGRGGRKSAFRTAPIQRGDAVETITSTGTIEPEEVVDVGAQVAGLISSFGVGRDGKVIDYGSKVEEGTILAHIDDSVYAADLSLAQAQVEQDMAGEVSAAANVAEMKAKADQAGADWKRAQELGPSEALAQSLYDSYKAGYAVANANVAVAEAALAQARATTVQARAALDKAQRNMAFCTIRSPVKGIIIDRRVNVGQTVVASLNAPSLFLIAKDLTRMQIWVGVNEADIGRIVPGAPVTFTCDAFPGRQFTGTVGKVRLNATMTQNVVMYTVEVNTDNSDKVLLPYLTATVRFVVRKDTDALLVPSSALRWLPSSLAEVAPDARSWRPRDPAGNAGSDPQGTLWIKDDAFVRPIDVKVGASNGASTAVFGEGLREGEEVVTGETVPPAANDTAANPFLPATQRR